MTVMMMIFSPEEIESDAFYINLKLQCMVDNSLVVQCAGKNVLYLCQ